MFDKWVHQYGDPFFLHALNGPAVVTGRPELVKQIFAMDPAHYDIFASKALVPVIGEGSTIGGNVFLMKSVPPNSFVVANQSEVQIKPNDPPKKRKAE